MKLNSIVMLLVISILYSPFSRASVYCEGQCRAYWETAATVLGTGTTQNEATENARQRCKESGGVIRSSSDCINHSSYYNCSLVCNKPNRGETSTSSYGDTINDSRHKITEYCQSYYKYYSKEPYFWLSTEVGACR
ncbi:MAG: hypothetical protein ACXVCP_13435 [Bdellovibrio sp.]